MSSTALVPVPGVETLAPDWWECEFVPWADSQWDPGSFAEAAAVLEGWEVTYARLERDTLELTRARRYLELRWGELLGVATLGRPREMSVATDISLSRDQRQKFRQLAAARDKVMDVLRDATEAEKITRAALLRIAKAANAVTLMEVDDDPEIAARWEAGEFDAPDESPWTESQAHQFEQHARKLGRLIEALEEIQVALTNARETSSLDRSAVAETLRQAQMKERFALARAAVLPEELGELAFSFE